MSAVPIRFVDHHFAHVTSAYFTSGFQDALVVSLDGGGDGKSSLVYAVRNGRFEYLHEASSFNSLGNYYAYVTHLCGFKPMQHEGKVTGLAAHGEPKYVSLLRQFIDEENGSLVNRGGVAFLAAIQAIEKRLPRGWSREDLAASIQAHCEDVARRYIAYWARRSGLRNIALAGGVPANVRVNEEIHRLPEVDRIFVHPHMGDGGLGAGAALAACVPRVLERTMPSDPAPLSDVYLGGDLTDSEITARSRRPSWSQRSSPAAWRSRSPSCSPRAMWLRARTDAWNTDRVRWATGRSYTNRRTAESMTGSTRTCDGRSSCRLRPRSCTRHATSAWRP